MADIMPSADELNSVNKITWWIISFFTLLFMSGVALLLSNISATNSRLNAIEIQASATNVTIQTFVQSLKDMKSDQIDRQARIGELTIRMTILDGAMKLFETRVQTLADRVSSIGNRLDFKSKTDKE